MQKQDRSAMLGTMEMTRLVPKISIPIMASMLIQALYNIVDSIFVSRFDPNGLTAVSLAFPFQMLMIALSTGMGTGINSLVSRRLGERQTKFARQAAWSGLLVEGSGSLLFILFGLLLAGPVMRLVVSENLSDAASIREMGDAQIFTHPALDAELHCLINVAITVGHRATVALRKRGCNCSNRHQQNKGCSFHEYQLKRLLPNHFIAEEIGGLSRGLVPCG